MQKTRSTLVRVARSLFVAARAAGRRIARRRIGRGARSNNTLRACRAGRPTSSRPSSDGHGKVLRSAAGKFYLQRPGKFRWDYAEPSEQLMLADGKQIWFYDKDLAQANVRDMDSTLASTPAMLLSGTGSVSAEFDIKALPDERRPALVSARPEASRHAIFSWCASASTRTASSPRCSSPTSSTRSRS